MVFHILRVGGGGGGFFHAACQGCFGFGSGSSAELFSCHGKTKQMKILLSILLIASTV